MPHPALHKGQAGRANFSVGIEEAFLGMDERLWLAHRGHIQIGQDVAQVLLRQRRANGPDGSAQHPAGLPSQTFWP